MVYNPGEPVEGYTNLLWVLLVAAGIKLELAPLAVAQTLGRVAYVAAVPLCALLAHRAARGRWSDLLALAPLAWLLLPSDYASFAGTGLETTFFSAQVLAFAAIEHKSFPAIPTQQSVRWRWLHGILPTTIVLTRPDGALFVAASIFVTTIAIARSKWRLAGAARTLLSTSIHLLRHYGLFFVAMISFAVWKLTYYGTLIPNTYYAKRSSEPMREAGLEYVEFFLSSYPHVFVLGTLCVLAVGLPPQPRLRPLTAWAGLSIALFTAYVVNAGGDFMHYRFAFHVYPLIAALAGLGVLTLARVSSPAAVLVVGLVFAVGPGKPKMEKRFGMQSHALMTKFAEEGIRSAPAIEQKTPPQTILAAKLAGTVAYYSDRTTIDQWGLTDRHVARLSTRSLKRGHMKSAPLDYLRQRGVNLEVGHPWIVRCTKSARDSTKLKRKPHSPLVFLRIDERDCLRTEYNVQTPKLTRWFCDRPDDFILDGIQCPSSGLGAEKQPGAPLRVSRSASTAVPLRHWATRPPKHSRIPMHRMSSRTEALAQWSAARSAVRALGASSDRILTIEDRQ